MKKFFKSLMLISVCLGLSATVNAKTFRYATTGDILGLDPPRALKKRRKKDYSDVAGSGEKDGPNWLLWGGLALVAVGGGAAVAMGGGGDAGAGGGGSSAIGEPPSLPTVP